MTMPTSTSASLRNLQTKEQIRTSIIDAALKLFLNSGFEHVSMRKIAEVIQYTPTTIYHHFQNKEELLHELFHIGFAKFNRALRAVFYETLEQTGEQRLKAMLLAYIEFSMDEPQHHQLIFHKFIDRVIACMQSVPEGIDKESYEGMFLLMQAVKTLVAERELDGAGDDVDGEAVTDVTEAAIFLWTAVNGYTNMFVPLHRSVEREWGRQHAKRFVDQLLRGMLNLYCKKYNK
jgi:AcrR family transcriptional regulator